MKDVAELIIDTLLPHGLTIHRYDSGCSKSIYLKLDCGMCNSIRISDHKSLKKHLKYRYNVTKGLKGYGQTVDGYERRYYPPELVDRLIQDILEHRDQVINKYGLDNYHRYMEDRAKQADSTSGFWSKAVLVQRIGV